ncbi:MAG: NAD(P)-dependent oxidoreductase [Pseudomonadota bacterium]
MTRVLVTGATGFLGGRLIAALQADGVDVVAVGRDVVKLAALPVGEDVRHSVDLADATALRALVPQLQDVAAIVHCAALSSPWGPMAAFQRANVTATDNVLALGEALRVSRLIHISTPSVYFRFRDQYGTREDMALPKPVNAYAATKAIAEAWVRSSSLATTILRPRGIYGAGDTALLPRLVRAAQTGPVPLFRDGRAVTDITHVSDVVSAIQAALDAPDPPQGTFNVSGGVPLRITDVIERATQRAGVALRWRPLPFWPSLAAARLAEGVARLQAGQTEPRATAYGLGILAFSQVLDLSAIKDTLGWTPQVSFDEGLEESFSGGASI